MPPRSKSTSATAKRSAKVLARTAHWDHAELAPVVLCIGNADLFVDRAERQVIALARAQGDVDVSRLDAASYATGMLATTASPSLFSEQIVVVVSDVDRANDDFLTDALKFVDSTNESVTLVLRHSGGVRGKKLLDAVRAQPTSLVLDCQGPKRDSDKADFVVRETRALGRAMDAGAVRAVVDAVGSDLRELAAAVQQLCRDVETGQTIGEHHVERYYAGRVEASGFRVADAVAAVRPDEALRLLRQSLATGGNAVPIVAAIAAKIRVLIKVGGARNAAAQELGLAPWQIDKARREVRGWSARGLQHAMITLADADEAVKGGGRDPVYAVEHAILSCCDQARS